MRTNSKPLWFLDVDGPINASKAGWGRAPDMVSGGSSTGEPLGTAPVLPCVDALPG